MRIFLDTNVLASALTARGLCAELFEVVLQSHDLLTSESVLLELDRILPEKLGQSRAVTQGFVTLLRTHAIMTAGEHLQFSIPDPDDEPIIAAAIAGQADVFVTGDKVLLGLHGVDRLPIVSPRGLWEILASEV